NSLSRSPRRVRLAYRAIWKCWKGRSDSPRGPQRGTLLHMVSSNSVSVTWRARTKLGIVSK
ncbi:hypothetical protein NDU88_004975, partial [Pleurodeles waltl]